jgi:NAD(P)-dependent dehydrogenase (short-subunit alcohol dehydrogenase family)
LSSARAALVIGAGESTGGAISKRFAQEGYVACAVRRSGDQLAGLVEEIEKAGGEARAYGCDARDEEAVAGLFEEVERDVGPIEVAVFNPGANVNFPIRDMTARVYRKVWEMACFAGFLTGREAARRDGGAAPARWVALARSHRGELLDAAPAAAQRVDLRAGRAPLRRALVADERW